MKRQAKDWSDDDWKRSFGELDEADLRSLRNGLGNDMIDLESDARVDGFLRSVGRESAIGEAGIPPLPEQVRWLFDSQRTEALASLEAEEAELQESFEQSVFSQPRVDATDTEPRRSFSSRFGWAGLGIIGAAAVVAFALIMMERDRIAAPSAIAASEANLLTPGPETGFTEPVFTWETDNEGAVRVEVIERGSGAVVASLGNAFSPLRFGAMRSHAPLEPEKLYEVRLVGPETELAAREFLVASGAKGGPVPAKTVDGIVDQCRELIGEGRHADAWMLWAELTAEQKLDPRMQALKEEILGKIAA